MSLAFEFHPEARAEADAGVDWYGTESLDWVVASPRPCAKPWMQPSKLQRPDQLTVVAVAHATPGRLLARSSHELIPRSEANEGVEIPGEVVRQIAPSMIPKTLAARRCQPWTAPSGGGGPQSPKPPS